MGGKDYYESDRELAKQIEQALPNCVQQAQADRLFLRRVVEFCAGPGGISQFLDIGTGLPTSNNTHEVAQRINPRAKVVYVDNDPLVLAHARALLTSAPEGATAYLDADMHEPDHILDSAAETLDLSEPVAITMLGVMWHILEDREVLRIFRHLLDRVPSGSYLAFSHQTAEITGENAVEAVRMWNENGEPKGVCRGKEQLEGLLTRAGLELVEPGVVTCGHWRPEIDDPALLPEPTDQFGGIGRKT